MAKYEMRRGDYKELPVLVATSLDPDAEVHFAVKRKSVINDVDATDSNALFTVDATAANAVDLGDGTTRYTIIITEGNTEGEEPGKYLAEIEYIDGDGHPTTYDPFTFILLPDLNQRP